MMSVAELNRGEYAQLAFSSILERLGESRKTFFSSLLESLIELTEKIDTASAQGKLVFGIFASLAEFERSLIRERVNAGLQAARLRGRKGGRPRVGQDKLSHASALVQAGYSTARAAKAAGIGRATLCRGLKAKSSAQFVST